MAFEIISLILMGIFTAIVLVFLIAMFFEMLSKVKVHEMFNDKDKKDKN